MPLYNSRSLCSRDSNAHELSLSRAMGGGSPYDNFLRGYRGAKPPFMLENALMFE